jgi:hypothetical protein
MGFIDEREGKETDMRLIRQCAAAAVLSATLVTAAQAHPFIGVGIVGGPVFAVASGAQSAPPLPVFSHGIGDGPAPLPTDAPPVKYAEPAIANIASITGHDDGVHPAL